MADFLSDYKKQEIEWKLKLSSDFPLEYIKQQISQEYDFICCVKIPWPLLIKWCNLLEEATSGEEINYIDLLNATVVDGWFCLKRSNVRLNELIRKKAQTVRATHKKTPGRKREKLDAKVYSLCIRRGELESIQALKSEVIRVNKELEEWRKSYTDLENEKKKLYEEMRQEITKLEENVSDLSEVNKELSDYIKALESKEAAQTCTGKKVTEVGPKQRSRKLKLLKNKIQCALWFSESFGLKLSQVKLSDEKGGTHLLSWENDCFETLQEEDNNKLEQILFLLDKFCVGDEVYHEMTIHTDDLPKSYLIKQLRSDLNKSYHIERTPGKYPGAAINFTTTLKQHIQQLLNDKPELHDTPIEVKISGDGARMSRTTNFMMLSFALLQAKESVMSSKSNRTVAIVNGPEKYDTMKTSLALFFQEVNDLIDKQSISIDGKEIKLKFFLGGDMKFLLMIMGMNSATADYACLWCKIFKEDRWDTSKPSDYYNKAPLKRDLQEIKRLCKCSKDNYGCINEPLLNIPLDNVIADELHLLLRVTDKLLQNIIDEVLERDAIEDFNKSRGRPKEVYLAKLVKNINDLGISFAVWNKKNADGSESNIKEFTSLLGSQKKKLLKGIPSRFSEFLYPDTCDTVKKVWIDFEEIYNLATDPNGDPLEVLFPKSQAWIHLFCSLRGKRPGYERPRVTPYMHIIPYHIPFFIKSHGSFKNFSGQGVEKNNDDAKRVMFHKSNKWNAARDILLTESRQWDLQQHERQKGTYTKRKLDYWETGITAKRKEQRASLASTSATENDQDDETSDPTSIEDYNKKTIVQLREIIKDKGLQVKNLTKLKKKELITLLENS